MPTKKKTNLSRDTRSSKKVKKWRLSGRNLAQFSQNNTEAVAFEEASTSNPTVKREPGVLQHIYEVPEHYEERMSINSVDRERGQLETSKQREQRLLAGRIAVARKRQSETPIQRKRRLIADRERVALKRKLETPEQREQRLLDGRERVALRRQAETPEQRERRLLADRVRGSLKCQLETPEQREQRLLLVREQVTRKRQAETPEQRERRLLADRERKARKIRSETPQEREQRLEKNRQCIYRKRQYNKNFGSLQELRERTVTLEGGGLIHYQPASSSCEQEAGLTLETNQCIIEIEPEENPALSTMVKTEIVIPDKMDTEETPLDVTIKNEIEIEEERLIKVKTEVAEIPPEITHPVETLFCADIEIEVKQELNYEPKENNYLVEREDISDKPTVIRETDAYNTETIIDVNVKEEQNETIVSYDYPNFDDVGSMDSNEAEALGNVETSLDDHVHIKHENENGGHQNLQIQVYQNNEGQLEAPTTDSTEIIPDIPETVPKYMFVMKIPGEVMSNIDEIVTSCIMNGTADATELSDCTICPDVEANSSDVHLKMNTDLNQTTDQTSLLEESDKSEVYDLNPFQLNSITGNVLSLEQEAYNMLKPKKVNCPKCPNKYVSKSSLYPHLKVHQTIENYKNGRKRGQQTRKKNVLKRIKLLKQQLDDHDSQDSCSNNQEIKVENKEEYKCTCGKSFQRRTRMETCLKSHDYSESEKYYCMTCLKDFKSKDELALHRKRLHRKKFCCKFCPTDYATRKKLFRHLQIHQKVQETEYKVIEEVIKGKKKLICFFCPKSCEDISELKIHVMSEHKGPYSCPHCKNTFPKIIDFGNHTKAYHPEVGEQSVMDVLEAFSRLTQEWKCEECDLQFLEADKLALHQVEQHSPDVKSEQQFQCTDCRRVFISQKGLTSHRRIHHNMETSEQAKAEDPGIMCLECRKMCKDMSALTSHMRFHSPDRKYPCKFCDFRFATPEKRKTHAEIHTGEMKYVCFICEYQCSSENRLKKHKQSLKHANMRQYLLTGKPLIEESTSKDKEKKEGGAKKKKKSKEEDKSDSCSKSDGEQVSCDVCGEKFPSESQMLEHKETHPFIEIPSADKPTRIFFK